jgi:hypothetical protein
VTRGRGAAFPFLLLVIPLVIGLAWGPYFDDGAYVAFRRARSLLSDGIGRGVAEPALFELPLFVLALALLAKLGMPLQQAALVLSTLGWGAAAVAIHRIGRAMGRSIAAVVAAALVVFSPVVVSTLGTGASWTVATAGIAIAASARKRWRAQTAALVLMLGTHLGPSTLALVVLVLVIQWSHEGRFPLQSSLVLGILLLLGWWLPAAVYRGPAPIHFSLSIGPWRSAVQRLLSESEFYWLFLLPLLCGVWGLLATGRHAWQAGLLWCAWAAITILDGGKTAEAILVAFGLLLVGLGIDWVIEWLDSREAFQLERVTLAASVALVSGLPLGLAQGSSLVQRYQFRPVVRQALEQTAGGWLRAHSEPTATVFCSEQVGYWADRPGTWWNGGNSEAEEVARVLRALNEAPPDYCVSLRSIAWNRLTRADWFRDSYVSLREFESPYDGTSPFKVWQYRFSGTDWGERQALEVRLPGGADWIGYSYSPGRIRPGDTINIALYLRAPQPLTELFRIVVEVISPTGGVDWGRAAVTPDRLLTSWWQAGEMVVQRIVLTTRADIPVGAYHVRVHMVTPDSTSNLPMYRDDDASALDQIVLGTIGVPYQGRLDSAKPVGASLGDQINLLGFEVADSVSPGEDIDVTLYWEAQREPEEDYIVFVHVLDAEGQIVASHDGPPMEGRYPTRAWLPGDIIPDLHSAPLAPDAPGGVYRLQVGMYHWPSMERLPVWDSEGVEQADRVIVLQSIEVR